MKNIEKILNHLPIPYDKIKIQRCLQLLIKGLPIHIKNNIHFMFLKGETLYFRTKHQAINLELYQNLNNIQTMLKLIQNKMNKCNSIKISTIKASTIYIKKNKQEKKEFFKDNLKFYLKHPNGNFKNLAKNKDVYKIFEEIRKIIKSKTN